MNFSIAGAIKGALVGAAVSVGLAAIGFTGLLAVPAVGAVVGALRGGTGNPLGGE